MASSDGSESLLAASDELWEHVCGPCKTEGNIKEAKQYCGDCLEYLCDKCVKYHIKLALTKNHKILAADAVSAGMGRRLTVFCACNKNQEIYFYCEDHADVICSPCKNFRHNKCQTIPIQRKSSGHTASKLGPIVTRAKTLRDKYDQLKQKCSANETELKRSKEACEKEIKSFRIEIGKFLDKLEQDMLAELDQLEVKENQQIERQVKLLTAALQILDADCQLLNDAICDGRKETMFVADLRTSNELYDYEKRLIDLEKDVRDISLSFKRYKKLDDLKKEIKIFGFLSASPNVALTTGKKQILLGRQVLSRIEVNVRLDDDNYPSVTGCAVMPNGCVVICDNVNKKIKLLNSSLAVTLSLNVSDPWDVSVFDANSVIVTVPNLRTLQFVTVFPTRKLGRVILLDKKCWGVHVAADTLYVTCREYYQDELAGEVRVMDKQGNLLRRIGGSMLAPFYITVNSAGNKVFVADDASNTITCMTADGNVIYQYKNKALQRPRGIYCDDEDNVLVCGRGSNNVHLITADGMNGGTLLSASDGLKSPYSTTFRNSDNTLIVGLDKLNCISIYYLKK